MTRAIATLFAVLCFVRPAHAQEPQTYFDYLDKAWAVGEVNVTKPLKFREGKLLAFPGRIVDLIYARVGRPRGLMLIHELRGAEPPIDHESAFFVPIGLLPQYSYWRDNLPKTPHHEILGGRRYIFKGTEIEEAKRLTRPFTDTLARKRVDRWPGQAAAVTEALHSTLAVLREDAVRYLVAHPEVARAMRPDTVKRLGEFATGDHPEEERMQVIAAAAVAGLEEIALTLEALAEKDDAVAAQALAGLERLGRPRATQYLLGRRDAGAAVVRTYVAEALGARGAEDTQAFEAALATLASDEPAEVRVGAARGLGRSRIDRAIDPLAAALMKGDPVSRSAGLALAEIGGPEAASALERAVVEGPSDAKVAAVLAMGEVRSNCPGCESFLRAQHEKHPDQAIRDLSGIVLELERPHKH